MNNLFETLVTEPEKPNTKTPGRVLVVDDEEANRVLLRDPLESRRYEVIEATDGTQALALTAEHSPDVILLDLMMPGLSGFEVCRRLKSDPRTMMIPIIMVTALSDRGDRLRGIESGANDFLTKPIDMTDVILRVGNAIRLKKLHDALLTERSRSEMLLLNMLPKPIAERMKRGERNIAETHPDVTVLFADLVGSNTLCSALGAEQLVCLLNEIFSTFDVLTARHGLEKIKSSGDQYLAAAGIPYPLEDHAEAAAALASNFQDAVKQFDREFGTSIQLRIGLASGSLVAGVIGKRKFVYDVWGDPVNVARSLASNAAPGSVLVSSSTCAQLGNKFRGGQTHQVQIDSWAEPGTAALLEAVS